jgi:hypothetical protein
MAYTTIKKPSDYFNTKLYTGNGGTNAITGVGFQPDWVWIKDRGAVEHHRVFDSVRGATKHLATSITDAEVTHIDSLTSFDSDGFTLGADSNSFGINENTQTKVAWNWLASNTTASNTDGSITSTVSANTTSGFSIVSYTGTGANATVGHGLGVAPKVVIVKNRDLAGSSWVVGHPDIGWGNILFLNFTDASSSSATSFQSTAPTSSVFSIGTSGRVSGSGNNIIAYCFAEKQGYSKFGSYTGNGNADGTFVYTGFKPAFVMTKAYSGTTSDAAWSIVDTKRANSYNPQQRLFPNATDAESATGVFDLLSNGFKLVSSASTNNASSTNYIYMAFAEEPLVGDNPATAR